MNIPTPPMIQDPATKMWQHITLTGKRVRSNETPLFEQLYGAPNVWNDTDYVEIILDNGYVLAWREDEIRHTPLTRNYQVEIRNTSEVDSLAFLYTLDPAAEIEYLQDGVAGEIYNVRTSRDIDHLLDTQANVVQYFVELI